MRFRGENIISFNGLEKLEKRTKSLEQIDLDGDMQVL